MNEKSEAKTIGVSISGGETRVSGDIVGGDRIEQHIYLAAVPVIAPLHQLPPPPADFTGREAELRDLHSAIAKGGVHISGLQGQGGVGKTALALKLAAELAPHFPDAQIYLDLKGVREKPLSAAEALSHVLRTFHPEAKLPEREDDLRALFHSVLHDKRVLLLMDNAKDAAQVKSLIPPEGCTLLVTSRFRFTLPGLHQKSLDTLPTEDAKKLLLKIAPKISCEAEAIAKLCGYLALALRLAATAIAEHIDLSPAEYRQQLADEKQRLKLLGGNEDEGVEASITLSYNLLDAETQKRWRMLAVFPDTFDAPAAASVWEIKTGVSADEAKVTLRRLLQYSMVEWDDSTKRYRLHDLTRDFARSKLTAAESDAAARRHARHYRVILGSADDLYKKGGDSVMRGLALFDLEWQNIEAGQAWAAANSERDHEAAELCSVYPKRGAFDLRQHPRDRIRWCEAALGAARQLDDRAAQASQLGGLGVAYYHLGDYRRAIEYHAQHLAIARDIADRRGEGRALGNMGLAHFHLGEYRRAIDLHDQHLSIAQEGGDRAGEGAALGNLGLAYNALGNHHRAIELLEGALAIVREIGDRAGEDGALGNLGHAYERLGDYHQAIEHYERSLAIAREIGDRRAEGYALCNLGGVYHASGDPRRGIEHYEQHIVIAHAIGDRYGEGNSLWNMSLALNKLGNRQKAIEHAEAALRIAQEIESPVAAKVRKKLEEWRRA